MGGVWNQTYGVYTIPCGTNTGFLQFKIGSTVYDIATSDIESVIRKDLCMLNMLSLDGLTSGPQFILGAPFHFAYCITYDVGNQRIAFSSNKR